LSLIRILINKYQTKKKILILDSTSKAIKDKTFSFWAKNENNLTGIAYQKWEKYKLFFDDSNPIIKDFKPYKYYSISSLDFYKHVFDLINKNKNITFIKEKIEKIDPSNKLVVTTENSYEGNLIFDNIYKFNELQINPPYTFLKQHFKGWQIESEDANFNTDEITIMDLRLCKDNEIHFMYILPKTKKSALIEYTIFSESILEEKKYDEEIETYLKKELNISSYNIHEEEYGIIPMTDSKFNFRTNNNSIFNIGTKGGFVKASTGYCFHRTQQICEKIAQNLIQNDYQISSNFDVKSNFRFRLYDSILLSTMRQKRIDTKILFKKLYLEHSDNTVFKFLDEETSLFEELKIIIKNNPILVLNFFSRMIRFWKW